MREYAVVCAVRQRHIGVHGREDDGHGEQDQNDETRARCQVPAVNPGQRNHCQLTGCLKTYRGHSPTSAN